MESNPGAPDGYTTVTTTKAMAQAPDPCLFLVPTGAQEVPWGAYRAIVGKSPTKTMDAQSDARMDAVYLQQQAARQAAGVTLDVLKAK